MKLDIPSEQISPAAQGTEREKGSRGWWWPSLWWIGFGIFAYVLGTGPVARLEQAGYLPDRAAEILYAPLIRIAPEHSPQGQLLAWYIFGLWKVELPPIK